MSLRSRMFAVLLAAATAFSAAFSGTANAAEPGTPDSSVLEEAQDETRAENSAEETEKEKEQEKGPERETEPERESESGRDQEPGQEEEETAGTASSENAGSGASEAASEPEESDYASTSEASAEDGLAPGTTRENAQGEEEMQEDSGLWATDRETAAEIEPGLPAAKSKEEKKAAADKMPAFKAEIKIGRYVVRIKAGEGVFPEGTKAEVKELSGDDARSYAEQAEEMADSGVATAVIDIRFTDRSGKEIQPKGMVDVVFDNAAQEDAQMSVYHAENGSASDMKSVPCSVEGDSVQIRNDSFSPYVLLAAASEPDWTKGGRGTGRNISEKITLVYRNKREYKYADKGYDGAGNDWCTLGYDLYLDGKKVGTGVCLDPLHSGYGMEGKEAGTIYEIDAPMMVKALYYGADGPGRSVIEKAVGTTDTSALRIVTHVAASELYVRLGYARHSASGEGFRDASNKLKDHVYKFVRAIEDLPVPDKYYAYVTADNGYAPDGVTKQDFGFGSYALIEHPGFLKIKKSTENKTISDGNSCYSYKGALYQVYTSEAAALARGTEGIVEGLLFVIEENGESNTKRLKPGKYYLIETRPAKGYLLSDKVYPFTVVDSEIVEVSVTDMPANDPAGIVINKTCGNAEGKDVRSLEGTEFTVRFYSGFYDASSLPDAPDREWVIQALKTENGLYKAALDEKHFVSGDDFYRVDGLITLPLGTVTIRETKPAEGYRNDGTFGDQELYIGQIRRTDPGRAQLLDVQGERATSNTFEVADTLYQPAILTEAKGPDTGDHQLAQTEKVRVTDKVTYKDLIPGREYTLKGVLVRKADGKTLTVNGREVTAEKNFTPDKEDGQTEMTFEFDAQSLDGGGLVAFEELYESGKDKPIAVHKDPGDPDQTVFLPGVTTDAADKDTGDKNARADKDRVIVDRISYKGLIAGKTYEISGEVKIKSEEADFDEAKTAASTITAAEGKGSIRFDDHKVTFVPEGKEGEEASGEILVSFLVDASELVGEDLVVGETIRYKGIDIAVHRDLRDEGQTVYIPDGGTTAADSETGDRIAEPDAEVKILDTLAYKNLIPGKTYTVSGRVVKKSNGEEIPSSLIDAFMGSTGNPESDAAQSAEKTAGNVSVADNIVTFTPGSRDGAILLTFTYDGSALAGEDAVVFERVCLDGADVIVHENLDDEAQTIHHPDGYTEAVNAASGGHMAPAGSRLTVRDRFYYKNLLPGKEYVISGKVMRKPEEGESAREIEAVMVDGKGNEVKEWKFTPAAADGYEDLYFVIDSEDLAGSSAVVFETLQLIDPDQQTSVVVVRHENIDDEAQTIHFPRVWTTAVDKKDNDHQISHKGTVSVVDKVEYENLTAGAKYRVKGVLMNKSTGKPALAGGKEITAEAVFTAKEPSGSVEVTFRFDSAKLSDGDYVAFETLYECRSEAEEETEIGSHRDLQDKAQTVTRRTPDTPHTPHGSPGTGDGGHAAAWLLLLGFAVAGMAAVLVLRRRKDPSDPDLKEGA